MDEVIRKTHIGDELTGLTILVFRSGNVLLSKSGPGLNASFHLSAEEAQAAGIFLTTEEVAGAATEA